MELAEAKAQSADNNKHCGRKAYHDDGVRTRQDVNTVAPPSTLGRPPRRRFEGHVDVRTAPVAGINEFSKPPLVLAS